MKTRSLIFFLTNSKHSSLFPFFPITINEHIGSRTVYVRSNRFLGFAGKYKSLFLRIPAK